MARTSGASRHRPGFTGAAAVAIAALFVAPSRTRAEGASPRERQVAEYVDAHRDEAIALVERAVNIPSATQNLDGVRAVGKLFSAEFEQAGFTTHWEEMPPAMKRAGHLIAEHKGTKGKRLLLIGHIDTVLEGRRFERNDSGRGSRASGNGTVDMKGGDVVILYALKALQSAGALADRRITVILTGDEEEAGTPIEVSRGSMRALAKRSDVALGFEAAIDDTATVARRGVSSWTLTIKARSGHSSGVLRPESGVGAIYEAARALDAFRAELTGQKGLTINPGLLVAGTTVDHRTGAIEGAAEGKTNVIAGEAVIEGDLRFLSETQRAAAEAMMRSVVGKNLPKTSSTIEFRDDYPSMALTPGNLAVLAVLDQASRDLDLGPVKALEAGKRGAGDIAFVADLLDGLDGLGARGERSHTPEEWMDLDTLPTQIKRTALLIDRLTHDETVKLVK